MTTLEAISSSLDDAATIIGRQRLEISERDATISELREALKPFAKEAAAWDDVSDPEGEPLWVASYGNRRMPDKSKFTLGDLRRARAALAKAKGSA